MSNEMTKNAAGPFWTRRKARQSERALTAGLRTAAASATRSKFLFEHGLPVWVQGFRVERLGRFSWAVVATSHRGR
jgi:hypothetical protein